jgi:DNA-binding MarR family transcriptional regulator
VAEPRLSRLQGRILTWLVAEEERTRGTMAADHQALVRALVALGFDKGNVSTSLKGLEAKGLVRITRTSGGKAEAVDLTAEGRQRGAVLTASCEYGGTASEVAVGTTKEGPVDLVAFVKDVAEPLVRSTIEVPVIILPLLFFGGLFMGWFMSH